MERMEEYLRQTATKVQLSSQAHSTSRSRFKLRANSVLQKLQNNLSRKIIVDDEDYWPRGPQQFRNYLEEQIGQKLRIK